jgi:integrase/recombinase XerD
VYTASVPTEDLFLADLTLVNPASPTPIQQLVDDYLMSCRARGLAPGTLSNSYGYPLQHIFLPWCTDRGISAIEELNGRAIDAFSIMLFDHRKKNGEPLSKFTVHAYVRAVRGFLNWCQREGEEVKARPALPRLPRIVRDVLDRSEIDALEAAAPSERDRLILRLLGDCGLRAEELCRLRPEDVVRRDRQAYLHVHGKGERDRLVPLPPRLLRRLERHIRDGRPRDTSCAELFVSSRRGLSGDYERLTPSGIIKRVRRAAAQADITKPVHTHLLRHSMITNSLRGGMNPMVLAQIVGHSSLRMIEKSYSHLDASDGYDAMVRMLADDRGRQS